MTSAGSLLFSPGHRPDFPVGHKAVLGPDAVGIKAAADAQAERQRVSVVEKHHRHAEDLRGAAKQRRLGMFDLQGPDQDHGVVDQQHAQDDAQAQLHAVVPRFGAAPREDGGRAALQEPERVDPDAQVRNQKSHAQDQEDPRGDLDQHGPILIRRDGLVFTCRGWVASAGSRAPAPAWDRSSGGTGPRRCPPPRAACARRWPPGAGYGWPGCRTPCRWRASW